MTTAFRVFSASEFFLGAFIVIGHNVFHILPNEVPILFVLGLATVRLRDGRWSAMRLKRPDSWLRIFLIALAAAALRIILGQFVVEPITGRYWQAPIAPALANEIAGNPRVAVLALLIVWTFAAFGEEIAYRGYLIRRGADVGARSAVAYWVAMPTDSSTPLASSPRFSDRRECRSRRIAMDVVAACAVTSTTRRPPAHFGFFT